MQYKDFINNIIMSRGQWFIAEGAYYEKHHIVPRYLGGSNCKENIIWLYPEEHYIAHKLLVEENPENEGLVRALWCMSCTTNTRNYDVNADEYSTARENFINYSKLRYKSDPNYAFNKFNNFASEEEKLARNKKLSDSKKVYFADEHNRQKQSTRTTELWQDQDYKVSHCQGMKNSWTVEKRELYSVRFKENNPSTNPEIRKRMNESLKNSKKMQIAWNNLKKKVMCIETGDIYESAQACADKLGIKKSSVAYCCRNYTKGVVKKVSSCNLTFKYIDQN